jgi:hypothetical protein
VSTTVMETLAAVFAAMGEHLRAATLFGTVEALRKRMGLTVFYPRDHHHGVISTNTAL